MAYFPPATFAAAFAALALPAYSQVNHCASVDSDYAFGDGRSQLSRVSDDGRFVVFRSDATNLSPLDTNGQSDVFRHDISTQTTALVSLRQNNVSSANGFSAEPDVSADGRYVVWESTATNLVSGDLNNARDIFVRDLQTSLTERISVHPGGVQSGADSTQPRITPDGRYVVFASEATLAAADTNSVRDIYRFDRQTGQTELVSVTATGLAATGASQRPTISDEGRFVAFSSGADFSIPNGAPSYTEIYRKDMVTGELLRVSVSSTGAPLNGSAILPAISGDGDTVAFTASAANLVAGDTNDRWDVFARDVLAGVTERISVRPSGQQTTDDSLSRVDLSSDGQRVLFSSRSEELVPGDTNAVQDTFLRDRASQTTARVSLSADGTQLDGGSEQPAMASDGRLVTFSSLSSNVLFGETTGVGQVYARSLDPTIGTGFCPATPNSTGSPGSLTASGSTLAASNDITLDAADLPLSAFGVFLVSETQGFAPLPGGSFGNLCLAGDIGRYIGPGQVQSTGMTGQLSLPVDLNAIPTPTGPVAAQPGTTLHFQVWHRDQQFGQARSNFTRAVWVRLN